MIKLIRLAYYNTVPNSLKMSYIDHFDKLEKKTGLFFLFVKLDIFDLMTQTDKIISRCIYTIL